VEDTSNTQTGGKKGGGKKEKKGRSCGGGDKRTETKTEPIIKHPWGDTTGPPHEGGGKRYLGMKSWTGGKHKVVGRKGPNKNFPKFGVDNCSVQT